MKPIKMLGLAALAAWMAMATAGASSAIAESTQLCKTDTTPCGSAVTSVHEVSIGKAVLESELPTIECSVLFSSTKVGSSGAPQIIEGNLTYSSCNNFCSVKEENGPAELKVLRTGAELAAVTGELLIRVKCPFVDCAYNGEGLEGHALGALAAGNGKGEISIEGQEANKEAGGEICPPEAFLDLTTTPLSATYIGGGGEEAAEKMVCVDVGAGNGFYLTGGNGTECGGTAHKTRVGKYELGWVQPSIGRNEMACAFLGASNGYYLARRVWPNGDECKDTHYPSRAGAYELGVTT